MNKYLAAAAALAASVVAVSSADATITFNLAPVGFDSGGSLSGTVSLNDSETMIEGYDFTTTAGELTVFDSGFFPVGTAGADYRSDNSLPIEIPFTSSISFASLDGFLTFNGVSLAANTIGFSSAVESAFIFGRSTGAGTLVASMGSAVPEPASWATMIAGVGLVGGALRRRQRTGTRALA